ncbi:MAG: hypothetical protein ABSC08_02320 [Bryobacteraceae bacterium]
MGKLKLISLRWVQPALGGAGLLAAAFALGCADDLGSRAGRTVGLLLIASLFYLIGVHSVLQKGTRSLGILGCVWIATVAFAPRAIFLTRLPSLSEDLYRYRWEGQVQAAAKNPYLVTPDDPTLASLRDETYPHIAGHAIRAIYGPLWEQVQLWTYRLARWVAPGHVQDQLLWMKPPSLLGDLATIVLLLLLLKARGQPLERVLVWAWCPLNWVEFWGEGHMDSCLAALLLAALLAARRQRWALSGLLLAAGGLIKYWPFFLLPLFATHGLRPWWRPRWRVLLIGLPLALLLLWPYAAALPDLLGRNANFATGFLGGWRNNDSLFGVIWWLSGHDGVIAKRLSLALIGALAILAVWRRADLERVALEFIAAMLLVAANVHPWYLSWLLPLLAVEPSAAGLLWVALMPLAYAVLAEYRATGVWQGSTSRRWWIYVPVFAVWACRRIGVWGSPGGNTWNLTSKSSDG